MIRVLANDDNFDAVDGSGLEGVEDMLLLGVDLSGPIATLAPDSYCFLTKV
jgi:hypothetical protein